ncbi:hypothetical protein [Acinetobacter kanungonis]|uniref:hypothetical protein n=1 Tax=Acinetobacter kanungonis TaxID=2699469 RepID=UPI00137A4552|nr:hypothetical protein [Acinetobacter kanungonis]NCI77286.1 hypothetical protein [Acinetobacter kanungonis]
MSAKIDQSTMEIVQESMGEAYESLQSLKNLVSSYSRNSEILRNLNDVLTHIKLDIENTNDIYKEEEKNIKNLMKQVYDITNEQKHISLKIPLIIKQLDQNETIQVMQSFDKKATEYQNNFDCLISKMNEIFENNFTKWNNSTNYLEYSNYVDEVRDTHKNIISAFNQLDLSQLNKSFDLTLGEIKVDIKDVINSQNYKLNEFLEYSSTNQSFIYDNFQKVHEKNEEYLQILNKLELNDNLNLIKQNLNKIEEKNSINVNKIETSINFLKATVETKIGAIYRKIEELEQSIISLNNSQNESFLKINSFLSEMEKNQKIIIEQTKKKGWFS